MYEIKDGYVLDTDGDIVYAKYDFGDPDFKVDFFEYLHRAEKFNDEVDALMPTPDAVVEPTNEDNDSPKMDNFLARARIERDVSKALFERADVLLGKDWCSRHVENKSIFRLVRAIGELANHGTEAVGKLVDETESMVSGYVNRAQKRAAARQK